MVKHDRNFIYLNLELSIFLFGERSLQNKLSHMYLILCLGKLNMTVT